MEVPLEDTAGPEFAARFVEADAAGYVADEPVDVAQLNEGVEPFDEAPAGSADPAVGQRLSPVVRKIAQEHNVDVSRITGTGIGGRVTKQDILAFLNSGGARNQSARQPGDGSAGIAAAAPKAAPTVSAPASAAPFAAAAGSGANLYTEARTVVNLSLAYQWRPSVGFSVDVGNVFNEGQRWYRGIPDQMAQTYIPGTTITVGVGGRF